MTRKDKNMGNRLMLRIHAAAAMTALFLSPQLYAQVPAAPAAPAVPTAPPALVYKDGVIKVGSELKQTRGRVTDLDKGDNGCYLTLRNEKNNEFIEVGLFPICMLKPPLKGKQVELTYAIETIQAGDCYGDPKCKRTETIAVVTAVKIVE